MEKTYNAGKIITVIVLFIAQRLDTISDHYGVFPILGKKTHFFKKAEGEWKDFM